MISRLSIPSLLFASAVLFPAGVFAQTDAAASASTVTPAAATAPSPAASAAAAAPAPGAAPAAAAAEPPPLAEGVVATVNDDIITSYDVVQRMRLLIVTSGIQPTKDNLPEIQTAALNSLIDEHLELQELAKEGKTQKFDLIASKDEVDGELADIARSNNTSADQLLAQLAAEGVGPETLRDQLKAEISWRGWIRGRYGSRLSIGEDEIKAYQQRLAAEQDKPQYEISEIFIDAAHAGGEDAAVKGATQLVAQLQKGAPFAAVARQFSASPTAANGGDVGWVSPGEMPPEVDRAMEQLRPGQLSSPIPVRDGVYIIYLKDRRAPGSDLMVDLMQAAVALAPDATPEAASQAEAKLMALKPKLHGCDNIAAEAAKVPGVISGDLGLADVKDLSPPFRSAAEALPVGGVSDPIRTQAGLHLIAVCSRQLSGAKTLTHDQIEDRLYGEELSMISKRQLRDLRNSATIDIR
ncbi:MAG TPA: peptidylprolyl isomerase [Caulobacteraceae bacterium]|nr:peptidylprolyl isomerase [Caulobacteraceae bacterium]